MFITTQNLTLKYFLSWKLTFQSFFSALSSFFNITAIKLDSNTLLIRKYNNYMQSVGRSVIVTAAAAATALPYLPISMKLITIDEIKKKNTTHVTQE